MFSYIKRHCSIFNGSFQLMSKDGVSDTSVDIVPRLQDGRAEIGVRYRVLRHNQPPTD